MDHCVLQLVPYLSADYEALVVLRETVLRKPLGLTFTKQELAEEHNQLFVVAKLQNQVIGGMLLVNEGELLKMRQVCVQETMQGKNIGKKLLDFALAYAKEQGYKQIYCHARSAVVPFYLKNNYQIQGEEFIEVSIPHVYMHYILKK